jgi:hypothetical protein
MTIEMSFHISTLAVITMAAKIVYKLMTSSNSSSPSTNEETVKSAGSSINLPSKTIQTTKWTYSSTPNALLFDFSELNMKKEQFIPMIKSSLPSNIIASIRPIGELLAEISIQDQEVLNSIHKQVHSILKNKGLHLKDKNIWLKPTPTLSSNPNLVFWQIRLLEYPKSMINDSFKKIIADTIRKSFQKRDKSKPGEGVLVISGDNVFFSNTKADYHSKQCSVTILAEEYTIIPPPFINPIRKLVYMPFMRRYLPIEISLVE